MHLANNIDDEDIKIIPEIFKNMDGDHDGLVNSNELKDFIQLCDNKKDTELKDHVKEIMEEVDINHNDRIDYREFIAVEAGKELFGDKEK